MITIEEKLNLFSAMVLDKAKKEYDSEAERLNEESTKIIEAYTIELNQEREKLIHDMEKKAKEEKSKLISGANVQKMKAIHSKKKEIMADVLKTLVERANAYTDSLEYEVFFKKAVLKAITSFSDVKGFTFYAKKKDIERFSEYIYSVGEENNYSKEQIQFEISKEDIIGGLICTDYHKAYRLDLSIKSIINNNENYIGTMLFDALRGADGIND